MFSKKATKFDKIFTVDVVSVKSTVKILSIFVEFLENMNFKDKILPHVEELELHHNTLSSCSQKVRACLGETGLKHRKIHHILPSSGGWETKTADYLNNVNPAGTVPVLVHNGEMKFS